MMISAKKMKLFDNKTGSGKVMEPDNRADKKQTGSRTDKE
jgi:hypothetical protein